jgi:hypothetical protein
MHLERVGGRFVAATAVLLAVAGNAAFAQEHKTYRCKVADVVNWDDDGHLRLDSNPRNWIRDFLDGIIIDTLTGAVTYRDGRRFVLRVVQQGDSRNDYVLIPDVIAATAATNFIIRIRAWIEKPILLMANVESFASGPCEVVR